MKKWILISSVAVNAVVALLFITGTFLCKVKSERYVLTAADQNFIDRTVEMYDGYIRGKVSDSLIPLEDAYRICFERARRGYEEQDELTAYSLIPDSLTTAGYLLEFVGNRLRNDLVFPEYYYDDREEKSSWQMTLAYPVFFDYIKDAFRNNAFWLDAIDPVEVAGIFPPTFYGTLVHNYNELDLSNKTERFMIALGFVAPVSDYYFWFNQEFTLKMDIHRNDSINQVRLRKYGHI